MKKILLFAFVSIMTFNSCNDAKVTESEQFSGLYVATTYTELSDLDGIVDILATGGTLTAKSSEGLKVNIYLYIPKEARGSFGAPNGNYNGNFSITNDTLRFYNTGIFLDRTDYFFLIKENQVMLREFTGRLRAFRIILTKR